MTTDSLTPDWRLLKKAETRRRLKECALHLFTTRGYDATTVEDIAAAAKVSHMTFFRYFPTKEDVVLTDEYKPRIAELVAQRPADEAPIEKIRQALTSGLRELSDSERADLLVRTRIVLTTPALRARQSQRQAADQQLIVDALARYPGHDDRALHTRVLAAAGQVAAATAVFVWAEGGGVAELSDIVEEAFDALRSGLQ